jgi:signal transduction histidine kinase
LAYVWGWGTFRTFVAPVLVLAVGLAILWQQWDATARGTRDGTLRWVGPLVGIVLVVAGVVALVVGEVGWIQGIRALTVMLLIAGGAALLALPWLVGAFREAALERKARIHEQARAELAAQVHDSVLQTLALIQSNAEDSGEVSRLARTEERRLRAWLYAPVADEAESLAAALAHQAARVEADHGAVIEVVVVGDAPMDERIEALVAAAGEAMVNAGKHAGPRARVSVFAEVDGGHASAFIRDRGPGFDLSSVPEDRLGVRGSIIGRLERIGGRATVAASSEGTEVRLETALEGQ